jgi:hypothetical protein
VEWWSPLPEVWNTSAGPLSIDMAPHTVVSSGGGGLFVDHKKGEIPELKNLLRDSAVDKDPKAKRAIMERVVGYMTLGLFAWLLLLFSLLRRLRHSLLTASGCEGLDGQRACLCVVECVPRHRHVAAVQRDDYGHSHTRPGPKEDVLPVPLELCVPTVGDGAARHQHLAEGFSRPRSHGHTNALLVGSETFPTQPHAHLHSKHMRAHRWSRLVHLFMLAPLGR